MPPAVCRALLERQRLSRREQPLVLLNMRAQLTQTLVYLGADPLQQVPCVSADPVQQVPCGSVSRHPQI